MVQPLFVQREVITGCVRGRPRRFGRGLTLQVQVRVESIGAFERIPTPPPVGCEDREAWARDQERRIEQLWRLVGHRWRDATWEDVSGELWTLPRENYSQSPSPRAARGIAMWEAELLRRGASPERSAGPGCSPPQPE
jgi:hypothetical protein